MELVSGSIPPESRQAPLCVTFFVLVSSLLLFAGNANAAGTPAGTIIDNVAQVSFDLAGSNITLDSTTATLTVDERIDVVVTLLSPQIQVNAGDVDRALLFSVTNTGNGDETIELAIDNALAGDDFDPVEQVPAIYFDTDDSGDFTTGDVAYAAGTNDPLLAADASVNMLLVNTIPADATNGQIGRSQLTANAATGTGNPGDLFAGLGDNGVDAVIGATGGSAASTFGEYVVAEVQMSILKSVVVADPFGGTSPVPGATLTYSITVEVTSAGTAIAATLTDPIPTFTTYVADSIDLNGGALSDATDADAGELDSSGADTVVVRLGDLTQADGLQTITFQVTID